MSETQVGSTSEALLNPELLQLYLAAFLYLLFPFAAFLVFFLVGQPVAAVLKLYLCAEGPSLAEVITQIDHSMGQVEFSVRGVVLMFLGL